MELETRWKDSEVLGNHNLPVQCPPREGPWGRAWVVPGAARSHSHGGRGVSEGGPRTREGAFALATGFKGLPGV